MLGVLSDFDPKKDPAILTEENLREVDIYVLNRLQQVKKRLYQSYKNYEYHIIFHTMSNFFTTDLSAFYLNFIKDNLYCSATNSVIRRTTQAVVFTLLKETVLLLAPILSFTAEEVWEHIPDFDGKEESVHMHLFPGVEEKYTGMSDDIKWQNIMVLRDRFLKEIEEARGRKDIGDSMEAELVLEFPDKGETSKSENMYTLIADNLELFKEILVVADIDLKKSGSDSDSIRVVKSEGSKCPRCWNRFKEDTSGNPFPELCPRCNDVVKEKKLDIDG
jgi:isoleucyl-tRNA synthetase